MAQNNDSPGKRLKREEAKNTIYVNNPNDPRLQAYRDSSDLYNFYKTQKSLERSSDFVPTNFIELLKTGESIKLSDEGKRRRDLVTKAAKEILARNKNIQVGLIDNPTPPISEYDERGSYDIIHPKIKPKGTWSGTALNNDYSNVNPRRIVEYVSETPKETISEVVKAITPVQRPNFKSQPKPKSTPVIERKVYEEIEPIQSRQSPIPTFAPQEIVSPVMRPVSVPESTPMKEPIMEEENVIIERPATRKPPKAVMPTRAGGWSNQPLLMKLFPKLYER
jgi:hypothetical protein